MVIIKSFAAVKKPMMIKVIEFEGHEDIKTFEGFSYHVSGETHYILEGPSGERWPIAKDIFKKTYSLEPNGIIGGVVTTQKNKDIMAKRKR